MDRSVSEGWSAGGLAGWRLWSDWRRAWQGVLDYEMTDIRIGFVVQDLASFTCTSRVGGASMSV